MKRELIWHKTKNGLKQEEKIPGAECAGRWKNENYGPTEYRTFRDQLVGIDRLLLGGIEKSLVTEVLAQFPPDIGAEFLARRTKNASPGRSACEFRDGLCMHILETLALARKDACDQAV